MQFFKWAKRGADKLLSSDFWVSFSKSGFNIRFVDNATDQDVLFRAVFNKQDAAYLIKHLQAYIDNKDYDNNDLI